MGSSAESMNSCGSGDFVLLPRQAMPAACQTASSEDVRGGQIRNPRCQPTRVTHHTCGTGAGARIGAARRGGSTILNVSRCARMELSWSHLGLRLVPDLVHATGLHQRRGGDHAREAEGNDDLDHGAGWGKRCGGVVRVWRDTVRAKQCQCQWTDLCSSEFGLWSG